MFRALFGSSLVVLAGVTGCASTSEGPHPTPASPPSMPAQQPKAAPICAAPNPSMGAYYAWEAAIESAYDNLAAHGTTDETRAKFRRAIDMSEAKPRALDATMLTGALSDEGAAL